VLIDNINRPLGAGALDAALTGTAWSERILGKGEKIDLPLLTIWYATGNNVTFKGDTARRCLRHCPQRALAPRTQLGDPPPQCRQRDPSSLREASLRRLALLKLGDPRN
jgi:hypothetical protein